MLCRTTALLSFLIAVCPTRAAQTEPALIAVSIPKYPGLERQARVEGTVKLTFTLAGNAVEPSDVEVESGPPILKEAARENVKTWKFENPYAVARKYETTFHYRLNDEHLHKTGSVTFESFDQVEILSETPVMVVN